MLYTERDELVRRRTAEIPDSTFDAHPEVIAMRERIAMHRANEAKLRAKVPQLSVGELYAHVDRLRAEKTAKMAQVAEVAFEDLLTGDTSMARAAELRADIARLEGVIEDLVNAIIRYTKEAPAMSRPASAEEARAEQAEKELRELFRRLARAQAQQEIAPPISRY